MSRIRLAIDATPLLLRSGGIKTYLYYWTRYVVRLAGDHQVWVFPFLKDVGECHHDRSMLGFFPTWARLAVLQSANYLGSWVLRPLGWSADIFHASNQLRSPPRNARLTTTVHDMTCWLMPEVHSPANVRATKRFAERVIRRADALIAVSESARADAVRILGLKPEKITVIHHGVASEFFNAATEGIRERYGLTRPFALFVGTVEPRKNLPVLLDAWSLLPASLREEFELVIAGPIGWERPQLLARIEAEARYIGYVPERDLPALTAAATVFVYPSLYEGFGLPVAQAMATGRPVVTSNISSLPEVAGDAALYVDPMSAMELKSAMERLLLSPTLQAELGARGRARARQYCWETCARRSWEFFEKLC